MAAFGCSLTDTSGLTSAPGCPACGDASLDASTGDAIREPSDAPGAALADAAVPLDPSDGTSGADTAVGPKGFCGGLVPAPLFCDDFDTTPLSTNWIAGTSDPGNIIGARGEVVSSPPRAVLASVAASNSSGFTYSQISHSLPLALRARVTFRALITPGAMHPQVLIGTLKEGQAPASTFASIGSTGGKALFQYSNFVPNGSRSYPTTLIGPWAEGVWQRFELLLVVTPPTATATVRMNDMIVVDRMLLAGTWPSGMAYFDLGCSGNLPSTGESVWIDDVTFDTN